MYIIFDISIFRFFGIFLNVLAIFSVRGERKASHIFVFRFFAIFFNVFAIF